MGLEAAIGLVVAGIVLLLAEIFVPGGVVGAVGAVLVLIGIGVGFGHSPAAGMALLAGSVGFGVLAFWLWIEFFPRTPTGRRMLLQQDEKDWHGFDPGRQALLGREGTAHTPLRPAGTALVDGKRVDVVTRGEMVEAGRPVRVVQVEGNRVVVTETTGSDRNGPEAQAGSAT